jgi:hypothetical protein
MGKISSITLAIVAALLAISLYQIYKSRRENLTGDARVQELQDKYCHTRSDTRKVKLADRIWAIDPNWEPPC